MKTKKITFLILFSCLISLSAGAQSNDSPSADESFPSFFARITRGGGFPGIRIQAPSKVQENFLKTIKGSYWVGRRDLQMRKLKAAGVDLWGDWYKTENSLSILLNDSQKYQIVQSALQEQIQKDQAQCASQCPNADSLLKTPWKNLPVFSRAEFVKAYVLSSALFKGKRLIDFLAELYQFPAEKVLSTTKVQIVNDKDFAVAVRGLGYQGPIYFRGITAPDPADSAKHVILLNEEMLFQNSSFDVPLLKNLELVGILVHELSHVFQDLKGSSMGLSIEVTSAESALMIEGSAEYNAEVAMSLAAASEDSPSALGLFSSEQGMEIVFRPGNESSGTLFPYTVGLPLVAGLFNLVGESNQLALNNKILEFLGGKQTFNQWLAQDLFKSFSAPVKSQPKNGVKN